MISHSKWIMPAECVEWNRGLCYELGLEEEFWRDRPIDNRLRFSRRQRIAITLMIMKLRIRFFWPRDQVAMAFGIKNSGTTQTYMIRGDILLEHIPELERCFTKLEGAQAPAFMLEHWYDLFAELFEIRIGTSGK